MLVVDNADRENEADLVMAAEKVTPDAMAFMLRHTSGIICVPMPSSRADSLALPPMAEVNCDARSTAFTVSVDKREGITTGVSATDRSATIRALADPVSNREDFCRPGHVFPLRATEGGVLIRPGHTEAAVDLTNLAGLQPVGAIAELMNANGSMSRLPDALPFAEAHGIPVIEIAQLAKFRLENDNLISQSARSLLSTRVGNFRAYGYKSDLDGSEHLALVGEPVDTSMPVLVRIQSECVTGEVFGSLRCDCGSQLERSMELTSQGGIFIYLKGHEGRGIGLIDKLRAYQLQDDGLDTVEANVALGLPVDDRKYWLAGQILADLGVKQIRLITNNPDKISQVEATGIQVVERVPLLSPTNIRSARYLETKRTKLGHLLPA